MRKKLTITIDEDVYAGLCRTVGEAEISGFIESLIRPHITNSPNVDDEERSLADLLAMPDADEVRFDPPRMDELFRKPKTD